MSNYSIKDLENLSGIKAHTLRIWEQRYALLKPKRTETNIRYYDDDDLKLILNVALLNNNGIKISKIAKMTQDEMHLKVIQLTEGVHTHVDQIYALTVAMIEINEEDFDKILTANIVKIGFEDTMLHVIYPFMVKIGVLWQIGTINPAQEHFISNLIRQKLIAAIDQHVYRGEGKKFLLFLPEGELHEISLLFAAYLIKLNGHKSIYLGQSTPSQDLMRVYEFHKPEYLITVMTTSPEAEAVQDYVNLLAQKFKDSIIIISGLQVLKNELVLPANVKLLHQIQEIKSFVESISKVIQEK